MPRSPEPDSSPTQTKSTFKGAAKWTGAPLRTENTHQALQIVAQHMKKQQVTHKKAQTDAEFAAYKIDDEGAAAWIAAQDPNKDYHAQLAAFDRHRAGPEEVEQRIKTTKEAVNNVQQLGKNMENLALTNKDMYVRVMHNARPLPNIPSQLLAQKKDYRDRSRRMIWRNQPGRGEWPLGGDLEQVDELDKSRDMDPPWRPKTRGTEHKTFAQLVQFVQNGKGVGKIGEGGRAPTSSRKAIPKSLDGTPSQDQAQRVLERYNRATSGPQIGMREADTPARVAPTKHATQKHISSKDTSPLKASQRTAGSRSPRNSKQPPSPSTFNFGAAVKKLAKTDRKASDKAKSRKPC